MKQQRFSLKEHSHNEDYDYILLGVFLCCIIILLLIGILVYPIQKRLDKIESQLNQTNQIQESCTTKYIISKNDFDEKECLTEGWCRKIGYGQYSCTYERRDDIIGFYNGECLIKKTICEVEK